MDDVAAPSPNGNPGIVVPSHKVNSRFDPYAFPADDHVPQSSNISSYRSSTPLQLSVHPKTYLPPGNPSSHVKIPHEQSLESYPNQFSACLLSPTQGSHPAAQTGQQFIHPSSKLENDLGNMSTDNVHLLKPIHCQQFTSAKQASQYQNGVLNQQADWKPEKPKKKKKLKAVEMRGGEVGAKIKKPKKPKEQTLSAPLPFALTNEESLAVGAGIPVDYKAPSDLTREPKVLCAKNAAPILPVSTPFKDSMAFLHSVQAPSSFTPTPSLPTTTTATTFTNSIRFFLDDRRQSIDSLELSTSRPASRTSTMSSSSSNPEGKTKESSESVSISKILEIIEREKSLGSSSPCKRRRTAKPQHIQEAEEEAKKYAAANAVQGIINTGSPAENPNLKNQESVKKSEQTNCTTVGKNGPAVLPQGTSGESSTVGSKVSSPHFSALNRSQLSNDSSDSQPMQTLLAFAEQATGGTVCSSSTPVFNKSTSHPTPDNTELPTTDARAATSSLIHSDVSKLPESPANKQISAGPNPKSCQNAMLADQSTFHQPLDRSDAQILSRFPKVNSDFLKPSIQENTQSIVHHPQHDLGMPDTSTMQTVPTASTTPESNLQSYNHAVIEEVILNDLSSSGAPMSLSCAAQGQLSNLQSTIQSLFHGSPSPAAPGHLMKGPHGEQLSSMVPDLSASDSLNLMDVKVLDLEPSLTCDLNNAWSQTADMISGNDSLLPHHPSSATTPTSTPKKPKKKRSPNKPKTLQSSPSSGYSLSVGVSSSGTLPPFGAFAGLKMNRTHPSYGFMSDGAHAQHLNAQDSSTLSAGIKSPAQKKKMKKSTSQTLSVDESTDRKLTKGSATFQEPLRECNSNLKSVGSGDKNQLLASGSNCKTVKPAPNTTVCNFKSGVTSMRPISDNSCTLSTEKIDLNNTKPCLDHHLDFKPGSNGVIHQRTVPGNTLVNSKLENVYSNNIKQAPLPCENGVKTGLNGISLNPSMDGISKTPMKSPTVMGGMNRNLSTDGISKTPMKSPTVVDGINRKQSMDDVSKTPAKAPAVMDGLNKKLSMDAYLMKQGYGDTTSMKPVGAAAQFGGVEPASGASKVTSFMLNGVFPNMSSTFSQVGGETTKAAPSPTPKLEPTFAHMSPEEELNDRLQNNRVESAPKCNCLGPNCKC